MVAAGRLTPGELRGPAWQRLFRDVYACADLPVTDRRRLNRLTEAGWTVVFVTAADLHHPERVLARIAAALTRATVGLASSRQG